METELSSVNSNRRLIRDFSASITTALPEYQYREITATNTIRLINLLAGKELQPLRCELEVVSLAQDPAFAALSYTWGENMFPERLICKDQAFKITKNLHDALVHFRLPDRPRKIWVDAVCINQIDLHEKALQIPLMTDIYSKAAEVLIWLGPASEGSEDVMKYLKRIGQKFVDRGGVIKEPRDERSPENDAIWADVSGDPNLEKTQLIWGRRWFTRRWIIQEMALASKAVVHCGTIHMDWDVLFHAGLALTRLRGDGSYFWNKATGNPMVLNAPGLERIGNLNEIRTDVRKGKDETDEKQIFDCMNYARAFDCEIPKDRVVALLGIFNRGRSKQFTVDYADSEVKIFEDFARYCLTHENTVDILTFAGITNHALIEGSLNLPSWVPDWRHPSRSPVETLNGFRAGHRLSALVELTKSSKVLLASGMLVDRVQTIVSNTDSFSESQEAPRPTYKEPGHVSVWYSKVEAAVMENFMVTHETQTDYIAGGDIWEALARTLIIDTTDALFDYQRDSPRADPSDAAIPLHEGFLGFRRHMLSSLLPTLADHTQSGKTRLTFIANENYEYYTLVHAHSEDRCFFITKMGYIGLGPREMQPGDVVTILAGSSVPYVMRPQRAGFRIIGEGEIEIKRQAFSQMPNGDVKPYLLRSQEERYQLIGECYTHGLMYGKVWDDNLAIFEDFRII